MGVSNVYTLYAVNYDPTTTANAMLIDGITAQTVDPRIQETLQATDGGVDPTFVATLSQDPRISFTTTKLATVLSKASNAMFINGLKIDSDPTYNGCEFWFQKLAEGGTRASGASHLKLTVKKGLLLPRTIRATQGAIATMDFEAICVYDGTNAPIIVETGQALEGSPSTSELFTIGKVSINGSALDSVQDVMITPGLAESVQSTDGDVWPTFAAIMSRQPLITITTLDVGILNAFGLSGTAQAVTDTVIYLRKVAEGGTRVADATSEHISFTIDEGMIRVTSLPATHGAPATAQIEIRPTYDGTNDILVVNPATAIT